jgi:hypothetical protein
VALAVVGAVVALAVALTYRPSSEPMPSLFALEGGEAQRLLEDQGYDVLLRPVRACEPEGLVVDSEPPVGQLVPAGSTVTVRTAVPSGSDCDALYSYRSDAWQFVGFALGGPAPAFAPTVTVALDGSDPAQLGRADAAQRDSWGELLRVVAEAARSAAPTESGMPRLTARPALTASTVCGVLHAGSTEGRSVLRIEIDSRADGDRRGCPLSIDLHRSTEETIDTVVVHTATAPGEGPDPVYYPTGLRSGDPGVS